MIRTAILGLCVLLLSSCSDDPGGFLNVRSFHRLFNERDLRDFCAIEIVIRGDEFWSLPMDKLNTVTYIWDSTKREFSYAFVDSIRHGAKIDRDTQLRLCALHSRKEELGILEISQSPWRGEFVKFWLSQRDVAIFLTPGFPLDSETKLRWKNEFDRGIRLDSAWAYYNMEWDKLSDREIEQRKVQLTRSDL
jgi:hypothetical protein